MRNMDRREEAEEQYKLALKANPYDAATHYNYGILLSEMGRMEEAEEQYKLALEADPNDAATHSIYGDFLCNMGRNEEAKEHYKLALASDPNDASIRSNYGILLSDLGRLSEAEEQYKLALTADPNNVSVRSNYGNLLKQMGRNEEAEEHYKLALASDPNDASIRSNYGNLLSDLGRRAEAEEQYKLALATDPKHVNAHYNYGNLLCNMGRREEAEEQYKLTIKLDPKYPNGHVAYGLFLLSMNLEKEAIKETTIASRLYREKGDHVTEHLSLAWLYETFAIKYYNLKDFRTSGEYAEISGNAYIEAGKHASEKFKSISVTKGYTLKGRAKIRKLDMVDLQPPYTIDNFLKIINNIYDASAFYKKAAEASPRKENQICEACSTLMLIFSQMLDYMLAVINQHEVPNLESEIKEWKEKLVTCEKIYAGNNKGKLFIESLQKFMVCVQNLENYKKYSMWTEERTLKECTKELIEISKSIDSPLQKIIIDSAEKMNTCRLKIIPYLPLESPNSITSPEDPYPIIFSKSPSSCTPPKSSKSHISLKNLNIYSTLYSLVTIFTIIATLFVFIPAIEGATSGALYFSPLITLLFVFIVTLITVYLLKR